MWLVRRTLHTRRQPHAGNCVASPGLLLDNTEKLLRPCVQITHSHRNPCAFVRIHVFKPRNTTPVRVESRSRGRANQRRTVCVCSCPVVGRLLFLVHGAAPMNAQASPHIKVTRIVRSYPPARSTVSEHRVGEVLRQTEFTIRYPVLLDDLFSYARERVCHRVFITSVLLIFF